MWKRFKNQGGFSMIELLVAVVILAIGLLGLAELQVTAMKANSKSEGMIAATSLAQEIIERLTSMNEADPMFDADVDDAAWPGGAIAVPGAGSFNVTYDVETNYQGVTNLCLVRITVAPSSSGPLSIFSTRAVSMTTLKRSA